jgi:peptide/nickel transport system ATP-binding protein
VGASSVLKVENLRTYFVTPQLTVRAVDGVSFALAAGERLALVGESGSGKSVTALSIMGLVRHPGRIVSGRILLDGADLVSMTHSQLRCIRGQRISMIFQDPGSFLDPMYTVGHAISEAIRVHSDAGRREARARAIALLRELKVPSPEDTFDAYPFQLSGGMCQRVLIAIAITNRPTVLIADEATSGLDATVQASLLTTLRTLADESGTAMLITTHSMQVVQKACTRVLVMYRGRLMEVGPAEKVLEKPLHPYTASLLKSMPALYRRHQPLPAIRGEPPASGETPVGCAFVFRCSYARPECAQVQPPLAERAPDRWTACPYYAKDARDG